MSNATNYTKQNVINALLRGVAFPLPTHTYVSLHTADPGVTGANEVSLASWPGYVRKQAEAGGAIGTGWSDPGATSGQSKNTNQLTFPSNDGAGAITISHFAVWDASTSGNPLTYGALDTARTLQVGDVFVVDVNTLTVTMA